MGGYGVNWTGASLVLDDIKIYPAGNEEEAHLLAGADRLKISLAPRGLLAGKIHARNISLVNPKIRLINTARNELNWEALDLGGGEEEPSPEESPGESEWRVQIDAVNIKGGEITYVDHAGGHRLRLTGVEMSIKDISSHAPAEKLPTSLMIGAKIDENKGSLSVRGRLNLFAEGINFKLRSVINNSPITYYRSFYAGSVPFPIESGMMTITSRATSVKSELTAFNHASIHNLKAGGGVKGRLVSAFVLSRRAPVEVDVTVRGNLEKGNLQVGSRLSKSIGDAILAQAQAVPGLLSPSEKIKARTRAIGDGVKGIFRR